MLYSANDQLLNTYIILVAEGTFPFAWSDRSEQYFQSMNDRFKKGKHLKRVGSDLEKNN